MNNFKAGDEVRCVKDNAGITLYKHYKVLDFKPTNNDAIQIEDDNGYATVYLNNNFKLVTQAMPTPQEINDIRHGCVLTREGKIIDCANLSTYGIVRDLKYNNEEKRDIMAVYKKNGYELELVWSRPEEKTKEEQAIELLEDVVKGNIPIKGISEAINILKENNNG